VCDGYSFLAEFSRAAILLPLTQDSCREPISILDKILLGAGVRRRCEELYNSTKFFK